MGEPGQPQWLQAPAHRARTKNPRDPGGWGPGSGSGSASFQEPREPGILQRGGEVGGASLIETMCPPAARSLNNPGCEGPAEGSLGRPMTVGHRGRQGGRDRRAEGGPGAAGEVASRAHGQSGERGGRRQRPDTPKVTGTPKPQGASPHSIPASTQEHRPEAQHTLQASHTHPVHWMTAATSRASLYRRPAHPSDTPSSKQARAWGQAPVLTDPAPCPSSPRVGGQA